MFISRAGEEVVREGEHFGVKVGVVLIVARLEFLEEGGVFFVGQIVGGDVIGLEDKGLGEGVFPIEECLPWDGEDEVNIDFECWDFLEEVDGVDGLHRGVLAAEGFEVWA